MGDRHHAEAGVVSGRRGSVGCWAPRGRSTGMGPSGYPPNRPLPSPESLPSPQKLLAEFPEKEGELSLLQALSGLVVDSTSPEGGVLVQKELQQLQESWEALRLLEEKLLR